MTYKKKCLFVLIVLSIAGLIPFSSEIGPEVKLSFTNPGGDPVEGVRVVRTMSGMWRYVEEPATRTDSAGKITLPRSYVSYSAFRRIGLLIRAYAPYIGSGWPLPVTDIVITKSEGARIHSVINSNNDPFEHDELSIRIYNNLASDPCRFQVVVE